MNIPLMIPDITEQDIQAVSQVLDSGMLVQGVNVLNLEKTFTAFSGASFAKTCSNGTATMHMALLVLGIGPGDEVIVPAFSYVATANVVELVGATPVFVDIEYPSFNLDLSKVEAKISPKTKAIMPVHEFGNPCEIEELMKLANEHGLYVIEDAACALGALVGGKHVGTFGAFGSFSFHPRKAITGGEGGMLTMNEETYDRAIATLRNHGIDPETQEFAEAGLNYRMTDFQAAFILSQFSRLERQLKRRAEISQLYMDLLEGDALVLPEERPGTKHGWQSFHVILPDGIDRSSVIKKLSEKGIGSNYGAQCIPETKFYRNKYQLNFKAEFPLASQAFNQGLVLPLYSKLEDEEVEYIANNFNHILLTL